MIVTGLNKECCDDDRYNSSHKVYLSSFTFNCRGWNDSQRNMRGCLYKDQTKLAPFDHPEYGVSAFGRCINSLESRVQIDATPILSLEIHLKLFMQSYGLDRMAIDSHSKAHTTSDGF